ncbi:MAG TPA: serine/threonine-protein kinase [Pyrinomonadaceae bacterium]|nr:serine/threonine-protein kinase [Pyrinomonadaceae bacterium]
MDVPELIAGRFRIEGEIGTGGMGTVYRAVHLGLERPVAIKIIKREFAADPDVADRFLREARTMARLRHMRAAMIFDAGNLPDGRHFIIMEFVHGVTLSEALNREGRFSPQRAVKIALEICEVLEEAHQLGIIHRDLKPSNIILNERGVCVLDFGVAKVLATSAESTSTHATTGSGQIIGTPRYMSPEQCLGQRVGARSDLYSLGVLLFEMLAGRPPFMDVLPSAVLVKQATAAAPPLPNLCPDIPKPLAVAVHTLLAKRPEDRPRTAADARAMLARSLRQPDRFEPELEPLSSTVAALGTGTGLLFRVGTPLALVLAFSAALLAWGYTSKSAGDQTGQPAPIAALSGGPVGMKQPKPTLALQPGGADVAQPLSSGVSTDPASISAAEVRRAVASVSRGRATRLEIVGTESGPAIVAVQNAKKSGSTHFFVMQKRAGVFRIVARGPLDVEGFRHAAWTTETMDADDDGYPEVLFIGGNSSDRRFARRLILYVPNERRSYGMFLTGEVTSRGTPRIIWSANSARAEAAPYRTMLRLKARTLLSTAKNR